MANTDEGTNGSPNVTGTPRPAAAPLENSAAVSSGRGLRKRSYQMSLGAQIVSAPNSRAIGAIDGGLGDPGLETVVEREEQIHGRRAAERQQVTADERSLGETRERRVDGVPPPERTELGARKLHHTKACWQRVELGRGRHPRLGRILVALQHGIDEAAVPRRGQVHRGQRRHRGTDQPLVTGEPARGGRDECTCAERESEHGHRQRARTAAEREHQRRA